MRHGLAGAQLAVRDVEEINPASQCDKAVPGRDVRRVIDGGATREAVGDRDGPIGADGEDPDQLLEVGAVVLGVPVSDDRGRLSPTPGAVGAAVGTVHADRRPVVVQLGGAHRELADRAEHDRGQQVGPVSIEQSVQCPTDPVVVHCSDLGLRHGEQCRVESGSPLTQRIQRFTAQNQVGDHQPDRGGRRQLGPAIDLTQGLVQQGGQAQAVQDVIHDRETTQRP